MLPTISQLISQSVELYKKNAKAYLMYSVLFPIITGGVMLLSIFLIASIFGIASMTEFAKSFSPMLIILMILILALTSILITVISIAFTRVIGKTYHNLAIGTIKAELLETKPIIIPFIIVGILTGLIILGGFLLLVIPGIIFSVWFAFTAISVALDKKGVKEAILYSKSLVMGRWWKMFFLMIMPFIVFSFFSGIISYIIAIPSNISPNNLPVNIITGILSMAISIVFTPLYTIPFIILYEEAKKNPVLVEDTVSAVPPVSL